MMLTWFGDVVLDGKILVNCKVGASRSATLVIAYLMLKQDMSAIEATRTVRLSGLLN